MTTIDVINRAGRAGNQIGAEVNAAAYEVAPLVELFSGLTLPDRVTVRLVTPRGLRKANVELFRQSFDAIQRRHSDIPRATVWAFKTLVTEMIWVMMPLVWRGIGGQHAPDYQGASSTVLITPRALNLSAWTPRGLRMILAHELTHAAQHHADPYRTIDAVAQVLATDKVREHKHEWADSSAVVEGHASWVHHRVMHHMYGTEMRDRGAAHDGPGAWSYRLTHRLADHMPIMAHKMDDYDTGEKFIKAVYDVGGFDLVNRLWNGVAYLPTEAEIAEPKAWIARMGDVDGGPAQ